MTDIVLLGLAADHDRIRRVVDALHANDLDFWWEREGPQTPGVADRVAAARCVVLFLTRKSIVDPRFLPLALQAVLDGKAIGARLDRISTPPALAAMTTVDLAGFRRGKDDPFLVDLAAAANAKAKGIDPPPPRGPISRFTKRAIAVGAIALAVLLGVLGFVADVFGASSAVGDLLTRFDHRQKAAYEAARTCEALRDFARENDGYYAELARRRYENPRLVNGRQQVDVWDSAYVMRNDLTPARTRQAAEGAAVVAMQTEAGKVCRSLAEKRSGVLISTRINPESWSCETQGGGIACGLLAEVICKIDQPARIEDCAAP